MRHEQATLVQQIARPREQNRTMHTGRLVKSRVWILGAVISFADVVTTAWLQAEQQLCSDSQGPEYRVAFPGPFLLYLQAVDNCEDVDGKNTIL